MALRGDFKKLGRLIGELNDAAKGKLMRPVTKVAGDETFEQFQADFAGQKDPFGQAWAPTKTGKTPVLYTTGDLANPKITAAGGVIRMKLERYAGPHQAGANGMAERMVVPFSPSQWDAPIQDKIAEVVEKHFDTAE